MSELKAGDCVKLKHGGGDVKMTIDRIFTFQGTLRATCKWYNTDEKKFEELTTSVDSLQSC